MGIIYSFFNSIARFFGFNTTLKNHSHGKKAMNKNGKIHNLHNNTTDPHAFLVSYNKQSTKQSTKPSLKNWHALYEGNNSPKKNSPKKKK